MCKDMIMPVLSCHRNTEVMCVANPDENVWYGSQCGEIHDETASGVVEPNNHIVRQYREIIAMGSTP